MLCPSARLQRFLGRELIADPNLAVIEFVKNAYDAGASRVLIDFRLGGATRQLIVSDDGIGMDVQAFSPDTPEGQPGHPVPLGQPGELVCTNAFPTMPVMFWNDSPREAASSSNPSSTPPPGAKYFSAYFARYTRPSVWAHGDFVSMHPLTRQILLHGRADGVLNPSGVRFGSAEIYNVLDAHFASRGVVADSVCVGQRRARDADESVLLFLLLQPGAKLTRQLAGEIRSAIARDVGRRCVPKYIFSTPAIPTTINGKKVEMPVKRIVSGERGLRASDTLANKESLEFYYGFVEVEERAGEQERGWAEEEKGTLKARL